MVPFTKQNLNLKMRTIVEVVKPPDVIAILVCAK